MKIKLSKESENLYRVSGRVTYVGDVLYLGFSGAFIEFETDSNSLEVDVITDKELQEEILLGRIAIWIDDGKKPVVDSMLSEYKTTFTIAIPDGTHKVRIEKLSEAAFGLVGIAELRLEDGCMLEATKSRNKRIEIIGDSITCGYGVEAESELQVFRTSEENPEKSYSIRTAKALGVEYHLVSWSGIGIITNWVPEDVNEPLEEILMPDLYKYRDLRLCERLGLEPELWDYSEYVPDLIIINIGTNDDSYTRRIPDRVQVLGERYGLFLEQVYAANPSSAILCILGTMGQNLCEEEAKQVELFAKKNPEVHIGFLTMPEQDGENDGMGADYHPSDATQEKASKVLTAHIKEFMNW